MMGIEPTVSHLAVSHLHMKHTYERTIVEDTDTGLTAFNALVAPASLIASTRHTAAHRVLNFSCEHIHTHIQHLHLFAKSNECIR